MKKFKNIFIFLMLLLFVKSGYSQITDAPYEIKKLLFGSWEWIGGESGIKITYKSDMSYSKTISLYDPGAGIQVKKQYSGNWNIKKNQSNGGYTLTDSNCNVERGDLYSKGEIVYIKFGYEKTGQGEKMYYTLSSAFDDEGTYYFYSLK